MKTLLMISMLLVAGCQNEAPLIDIVAMPKDLSEMRQRDIAVCITGKLDMNRMRADLLRSFPDFPKEGIEEIEVRIVKDSSEFASNGKNNVAIQMTLKPPFSKLSKSKLVLQACNEKVNQVLRGCAV